MLNYTKEGVVVQETSIRKERVKKGGKMLILCTMLMGTLKYG